MKTIKDAIQSVKDFDWKNSTQKEIEDILPTFGLNNEFQEYKYMPKEFQEYMGWGIKTWQYPNQFSKYLKQLSKYEINSYLEIGCRWGGTFIITNEMLKLKNKDVKSYACDLIPICDVLTEYKKYSDFTYIHESSFGLTKNHVGNQIDLILIDADHSYDAVKKDLEVAKQFNPKYVVFHDITNDICMGVTQFWNEIKNEYTHYEYIEQYDSVVGNYLGIGLIEL